MKNFNGYILIISLFLNVFLAFRTSYYYESANVKIVEVVHRENLDLSTASVTTHMSEDTTSFVIDFVSKIDQCDTFLWTVSENNREIKYSIWFAK